MYTLPSLEDIGSFVSPAGARRRTRLQSVDAETTRGHTEYVTVDEADLKRMLTENLVAERIIISSYQQIVRWIGDADPTTRRADEKNPRAGGRTRRRSERSARQLMSVRR